MDSGSCDQQEKPDECRVYRTLEIIFRKMCHTPSVAELTSKHGKQNQNPGFVIAKALLLPQI